MKKWCVKLGKAAHKKIAMILRSKRVTMKAKKRAQILMDSDENNGKTSKSINEIANSRGVCQNTVVNVRKNYVQNGLDVAIFRKKRETPPVAPKVTGRVEAHIIATCCSAAPEGHERWTAKMIANKVVLDAVVESISDETVRLVLKKHNLSLT